VRRVVLAGSVLAALGAAHAAANAVLLRRPDPTAPAPDPRVSVLLPVRDEAPRIEACVRALLAQRGDVEVLVLDDRGGVADGTAIATCRMYSGWSELRDGYTKSLWSAFGSRLGAAAVLGLLGLAYVVPAVAALAGSPAGLAGYAAGVTGRVVAAGRTGGRAWPDALAHPVSVITLSALAVRSWRARSSSALRWKGRAV
jgi:cellulose synthase/poly-beta-1,6-N-acetylglucosamine synthase-like glycosyltransferase